MMTRCLKLLINIFIFGLIIAISGGVFAQSNMSNSTLNESSQSLKAGVYVSPPFIMKDETSGKLTGMALDLWKIVSANLNLDTEYKEYENFRDLVQATNDGDIDVAITNLTISKNRVELIDFTHPWYDAGLRIMVHEEQSPGFRQVFRGLQSSGFIKAYLWIAGVILMAAMLLTIFDRRFDHDFPKKWRDGFAESFYTVMSVATSGRSPSRKNLFGWLGRIWQGLWLVCGVAVLAYVTSSVTSVMTTLSLTNQINSISDLSSRRVGVFTGSIAEEYARNNNMDARSYSHIEEAVKALQNDQIAGIIADAPVLEYYVYKNPSTPVRVVGPIFEPDKYGFGLGQGSPLTRPLTVELVGAHERGEIAEIRKQYFGEDK